MCDHSRGQTLRRINASGVRSELRNLGCSQMEGADNPVIEFWVTNAGKPFSLPYFNRGQRDEFLAQAVESELARIKGGHS